MDASNCAGSLTVFAPWASAGMVAQCPVCGAPVTIGYGGRVPAHPVPTEKPRSKEPAV